jgi:hypothetical protein
MYGSHVVPGLDIVEYEHPDGSGTWVQCEPADTSEVAERFRTRGCIVWVNGEGHA